MLLAEDQKGQEQRVLKELDALLRKCYDLNHNTIQVEVLEEDDLDEDFCCGNDIH